MIIHLNNELDTFEDSLKILIDQFILFVIHIILCTSRMIEDDFFPWFILWDILTVWQNIIIACIGVTLYKNSDDQLIIKPSW